jgi:hypothetical protein
MFTQISVLKKVELNEFYIESLLLEVETDELKLFNQLFNLISGDDDDKNGNDSEEDSEDEENEAENDLTRSHQNENVI